MATRQAGFAVLIRESFDGRNCSWTAVILAEDLHAFAHDIQVMILISRCRTAQTSHTSRMYPANNDNGHPVNNHISISRNGLAKAESACHNASAAHTSTQHSQ